jgi:hypothetical protein
MNGKNFSLSTRFILNSSYEMISFAVVVAVMVMVIGVMVGVGVVVVVVVLVVTVVVVVVVVPAVIAVVVVGKLFPGPKNPNTKRTVGSVVSVTNNSSQKLNKPVT